MLTSGGIAQSIECNGEISFETSPIDRVHVVGGAFIHAGIHLGGRIDFDFRFHSIITDAPFVDLH